MHQRRHPFPDVSKKPSKMVIFVALAVACILPYVVIKSFSVKKTSDPLTQTVKLPSVEVKSVKPPPIVAASTQFKPRPTLISLKPVQSTSAKPKNEVSETWIRLNTRAGDSMAVIFKRVGLTGQTLQAVMKNNKHAKLLTRIRPNQPIQFLIQHKQLERLLIDINKGETLEITRDGDHYHATLNSQKTNVRERYVSATVQYSLYNTAKRQNIPYKLIQQMTEIFKQEVNLVKEVRGGDRFTIIYQVGYVDNKPVNIGDIVAVTYTHRGVSHRALRHVDAKGNAGYFSPDGQSMKQGFSRYPVKFSHINSAFSLSRMHPILHYNRPHKGIDLAAPMGTPIYATGDGRVQHLGYESGYGNVIKISHHNSIYTSVYAHLSKFRKGLFPGSVVKRGQVIGYVGKSGLATAPHLHYEFHVHHRPKNPKTVPLPQAEPVPRRDLASFKRHADKLIEHLKLFEKKRGAGEARAVG
jgi:murein DD-endopeptidase MepM/ murein hydrolase activator NlpD